MMFKIKEKFEQYMRDVLDGAFLIEACDVKLPLFLKRYRYYRGRILGRELIFAFVLNDEQTPSDYAKMALRLQSEFEMPIVFVYEKLPISKRNALIRNSVPFVVPMLQLFLPPYLDLHERGVKIVEKRKAMRPASQALLIRQLTRGDVEGCSSKELSSIMRCTQMTLSNVISELVELGLCHVKGWPKRIYFEHKGRELWNAALPMLKSPVQKILLNAKGACDFCVAGLTALSELTMIAPETMIVYACASSDVKAGRCYEKPKYEDEAKSALQVWNYDPKICGDALVDRLSLYLTFKEHEDPRIKKALEELLEGMQWQ
jgi:hypothetical protein